MESPIKSSLDLRRVIVSVGREGTAGGQRDGTIVAVKRRAPFARYFATVADIQALKEIPETSTEVPA